MTPNKTKSGLFETPRIKITTPTTPRASKSSGRASSRSEYGSNSPLQTSRLSIDRSPLKNSHLSVSSRASVDRSPRSPSSPRSVDSRSTVELRSARIGAAIGRRELKQQRTEKGSELLEELNIAHEDLKKVKEQLLFAEKEKARALEELKEVKRHAYDANEKLTEALAAQKQAEERTEIEKFRAVELEQAGIEATQQKEEVWQKELESIRSQHALDASALLSTTQELEKVKEELAMTLEAKNVATIHADEALQIAEVNAEKVGMLSGEVTDLKALLELKLESKDIETAEQVKKLNSEIGDLRGELEKAKDGEKKLIEMETEIECLKTEVFDVKKGELDTRNLAEEWKKKAEFLQVKVKEALESDRSASEALASALKKLEECNASLQDAESEISKLKGKVESLEMEITKHKEELTASNHHNTLAKNEVVELEKEVKALKSELRSMEVEKIQALDNERKTSSDLKSLLEEKNKLLHELEISNDELAKSKQAMDDLASALRKVKIEARESREWLLEKQVELSVAKDKIVELQNTLKHIEERYKSTLEEAKNEIVHLKATVEGYDMEANNSKSERHMREHDFVISLGRSEDELAYIKGEMEKVTSKLEATELDAIAAKEEGVKLSNRLKQAATEASSANESAEKARTESARLKERLLDKENELQSIAQENDDLRSKEKITMKKIEELSALLEEAKIKKTEENSEVSNTEKDYDVVSKTTEFSDAAEGEYEEHEEMVDVGRKDSKPKSTDDDGKAVHEERFEMNIKRMDKGLPPDRDLEQDVVDDESSSKADSEVVDQTNGLHLKKIDVVGSSPNKDNHLHKKKSPLLRKFGKFLKKSSHK